MTIENEIFSMEVESREIRGLKGDDLGIVNIFYIMTAFGSDHNLALFYAVAGNVSFGVLQIVFKTSIGALSSFELLYIRSVFLFFITVWLINRRGLSAYIPSPISDPYDSQRFTWCWSVSCWWGEARQLSTTA